ncbi:LysR family transcriptional regulator [Methylophilus sp. DW102]|uniref:LysR family transcriptional regulator n=1 Tax=Methylophilus sp. DW102 TaxID=3095607 RepID=UPI00308D21B1|nr:LysR family transcriptional regulator [Methylophilus sp. DW102]
MSNFDPVKLGSIEQFCKAAELGNFTSAAEQLGLTPASVSRSISRLEKRLGVQLFVRTTRNVRLTNEGQHFWQQCRLALDQIAEAELTVSGQQKTPTGPLRISVGSIYAHHRLFPLLPAFRTLYPHIQLEISVSNKVVDFIAEGCDLAIRVGVLPDSQLIAQKIENAALGIFASPEYLSKNGVPKSLEDLQSHDCIQFILPTTGRPMPWILKDLNGQDIEVVNDSHLRVYEDANACVSWSLAGGGLVQTYHFLAQDEVKKGRLMEVLEQYSGRSRQFSIIYPANRYLSSKVRAFSNFIKSAVQQDYGRIDI